LRGELEYSLFEEILPKFDTTIVDRQIVYIYKGNIHDLFWKIAEGIREVDRKLARKEDNAKL
jgi:hypothetical protein